MIFLGLTWKIRCLWLGSIPQGKTIHLFFSIPTSRYDALSVFFLNLQNSVSKHEYLGEYTGELISHKEADKRGKIYDRENSSFLFNLNNEVGVQDYPLQAFSYYAWLTT